MPELPEVETTRRGIATHIVGKKLQRCVVRQPSLRWPIDPLFPAAVEGRQLKTLTRRGKYLLFDFGIGTTLIHLGMSGSMRIVPQNYPVAKHDHVDLVFNKTTVLRFNDPRRFGAVIWTQDPPEQHPLICHLGPEPLLDDFTANYLYDRSRNRKQAIKTLIMDSRIVVGVGNIYANEALFDSGIHPLMPAAKLSKPRAEKLVTAIKAILTYAIQRGGTTLRDFVGGDGKPGYFAQELNVYGRGGQPCKHCQKILTEKRVGQRTTVFCLNCQKR